MSLYNMLFNTTLVAGEILRELGVKHQDDFGRPRDAWVSLEPEPHMVVLTRCGGHNRKAHQAVFDEVKKHPLYRSDEDDEYDSTYAYIRFNFADGSGLLKEVHEIKLKIEEQWGAYVAANGANIPPESSIKNKLGLFIRDGQPLKEMFEAVADSLRTVADDISKGQ